jgi:hypothetical protein
MGGKAVPQDVRREVLKDAGLLAVEVELFPEGLAGEGAAAGGDKEGGGLAPLEQEGAGGEEIGVDGIEGALSGGDEALFTALAGDAEEAELGIESGEGEGGEFGDAEAAGIEDFEHGAVAEAGGLIGGGSGEQGVDLGAGEVFRKILPLAGGMKEGGRVVVDAAFAKEEAEEVAEGGDPAGEGAGGEAGGLAGGEVVVELSGGRGPGEGGGGSEKSVEVVQITTVSGEGMGREALLDPAMGEEGFGGTGKPVRVRHWCNDTITAELIERKGLRQVQP